MSVKSETISEDGQWRIVSFHRTPIMSSYLVCYVVGEFDRIETVSGDGVKVDVFTAPGKSEQGRFALDVAAKALDFYRKYFDIAYPLDKLSLIAYPDLSYGAMGKFCFDKMPLFNNIFVYYQKIGVSSATVRLVC